MDSSRSGQSEKGDCRSAERGCGDAHPETVRKAPGARFLLPREADHSSEYESVVQRLKACWDKGFPLARPAAHMGKLARAERNAAVRAPGAGWLGKSGDGEAIRALISRAFSALCEQAGFATPFIRKREKRNKDKPNHSRITPNLTQYEFKAIGKIKSNSRELTR